MTDQSENKVTKNDIDKSQQPSAQNKPAKGELSESELEKVAGGQITRKTD